MPKTKSSRPARHRRRKAAKRVAHAKGLITHETLVESYMAALEAAMLESEAPAFVPVPFEERGKDDNQDGMICT